MSNFQKNKTKDKTVFCAIDLHDISMLAGIAVDQGGVKHFTYNTLPDKGIKYLISGGIPSMSKRSRWNIIFGRCLVYSLHSRVFPGQNRCLT